MSLSTPTLLDATAVAAAATSITSASVTPTSDALLVVVARCGTADESANIAVTGTTLANVGTWTNHQRVYAGSANGGTILIATAQITGSAGSGTVTVGWTGSNVGRAIQVIEVTGHDTATPVTQSKAGAQSSTGTTYSFSLDASPAATSVVIAGLTGNIASANNVLAGSLFTEISEQTPTTNQRLQTEYDITSAGTTVDWSGGLTGGSFRRGVAIEVAEASVSTFVPTVMFL